jgi:hypothetical protein
MFLIPPIRQTLTRTDYALDSRIFEILESELFGTHSEPFGGKLNRFESTYFNSWGLQQESVHRTETP